MTINDSGLRELVGKHQAQFCDEGRVKIDRREFGVCAAYSANSVIASREELTAYVCDFEISKIWSLQIGEQYRESDGIFIWTRVS